jgi:hypothetical protein
VSPSHAWKQRLRRDPAGAYVPIEDPVLAPVARGDELRGLNVTVADNGEVAIAKLAAMPFEIVLMDGQRLDKTA